MRIRTSLVSVLETPAVNRYYHCSLVSLGVCASNARSEMSYSSEHVSLPILRSGDYASAAWCLIPAHCTTSKSNSENRRCHQAARPVQSANVRIHFSAPWSVRMVNQCLFLVWLLEKNGPHDRKACALAFVISFFSVCNETEPVPNRYCCVVEMFL